MLKRNETIVKKKISKKLVFIGLILFFLLSTFILIHADIALTKDDIFIKIISNKAELTYGETIFEIYVPSTDEKGKDDFSISEYLDTNFIKAKGANIDNYQIYINYSKEIQIPIINETVVNLITNETEVTEDGKIVQTSNSKKDGGIIGYKTAYSEDFMPIKNTKKDVKTSPFVISPGYYKIKIVANWKAHIGEQSIDWIPSIDISEKKYSPDWAWWNVSWIAKKNFTINEYYVDDNITNFTLFVHLNKTNFNFSKILLNGSDIRFTDEAETNQLDYEIDMINSSDAYLWVRIPSVSNISNTTVWIYYNNSAAGDGQNKLRLWGEWLHVYHFNGTKDSKGTNNLTAYGGATLRPIPTPLGTGYNLTNTTADYFKSDKTGIAGNSTFTIIAYQLVYGTDAGASPQVSIASERDEYGNNWQFILSANDTGSCLQFSSWNPEKAIYSRDQVSLGVFNYLAAMRDSNKVNLYINETNQNSSSITGYIIDSANSTRYGRWSNLAGTRPDMIGIYDDLRITNKSMSESWIKADYYSVTDQINTFQSEIIDTTPPDIHIVFPSNHTNSSNNQLNVNFTVSDDISLFSCWYTNNSGKTNNTLTCGQNITGVTWPEGINNVSVYAKDYSGNENVSHVTFTIDTIAPSVVIYHPLPQNYNYNTSINISFSIIHNPTSISSCWYNIVNKTGGGIVIDNTTLSIVLGICQNSSFNLTSLDNDYNLTLYANDSVNNVNYSMVSFGIKTSTPSIVLNSPPDNQYFNNGTDIYINFTAVRDIGIDTCELWGNWTGIWHKNYTWIAPTNNTMNYTALNFTGGRYIWNVKCNDTADNIGWALNNYTFNVDLAFPNVSIDLIILTTGSKIVSFNSTEEDNFGMSKCWYSVFNTVGLIDGSLNNISYTCSSGIHSFIVSDYATYNLTIYANDTSNNENSSTSSFTTVDYFSPLGGSGGPSVPPQNVTIGSFCGDNICDKPNSYGVMEDFYNCQQDCKGLNLDDFFYSLLPWCIDNNESTSCLWTSIFLGFSTQQPENLTKAMSIVPFNADTTFLNCFQGKECFWETSLGVVSLFGIIIFVAALFIVKIPYEKGGSKKGRINQYILYKIKDKNRKSLKRR